MNLISCPDKFYILIQPFAEDLLIEPKGILNYSVPLLTELFIDCVPAADDFSGAVIQDYTSFIDENKTKQRNKYLSKLPVNQLTRQRLDYLWTNISQFDNNKIAKYILGIIPTAYVCGRSDIIKSIILSEEFSGSEIKAIRNFIGDENGDIFETC